MNNTSFLQNRAMGIFSMFMIFVYFAIGIGMLFFWQEVNNHTAIGILLTAWASFRTYMLIRHRARMKNSDQI